MSRIQSVIDEAKMEGLEVGITPDGNIFVHNSVAEPSNDLQYDSATIYSEVTI